MKISPINWFSLKLIHNNIPVPKLSKKDEVISICNEYNIKEEHHHIIFDIGVYIMGFKTYIEKISDDDREKEHYRLSSLANLESIADILHQDKLKCVEISFKFAENTQHTPQHIKIKDASLIEYFTEHAETFFNTTHEDIDHEEYLKDQLEIKLEGIDNIPSLKIMNKEILSIKMMMTTTIKEYFFYSNHFSEINDNRQFSLIAELFELFKLHEFGLKSKKVKTVRNWYNRFLKQNA